MPHTCLTKRKLVFGDPEQIKAIKEINECYNDDGHNDDGHLLKDFCITAYVNGEIDISVLAKDRIEAIKLVKLEFDIKDVNLHITYGEKFIHTMNRQLKEK